ncbi:MAG: protein kinase [Holophagales bacterium]|nr:protein kinase [Holophagales bacterium]
MTQKGRRLGRYRLEELLGQGGMAEVWRAADERLGRTVAVKVIHSAHLRDGHFRERFHREARLVASLDHPNVLPVYDYGDEEGVPYLVMPYLDGGTLRDRMMGSPIPFAQAVSWIHQLADALDAAHAAGILHRDVKPANVLIRRDDRLALADFGIAKMVESPTGLTATGMVVGTPIYMAPEQAQGKPATPASDLYALAVLAYELLSGRPPFDGESALALMHQHVTAPAPLLSSSVHGLPAGLDPIFEQALAKEPERRPPTGRAFARQLFAFVPTGTGLDLERATMPWNAAAGTFPAATHATPKRRAAGAVVQKPDLTNEATISTSPQPTRRTLTAVAGATVAVAVLAGVWFLTPRSRPDTAAVEQVPAPAPTVAPPQPPAGEAKVAGRRVPTPAPVAASSTVPAPATIPEPADADTRGRPGPGFGSAGVPSPPGGPPLPGALRRRSRRRFPPRGARPARPGPEERRAPEQGRLPGGRSGGAGEPRERCGRTGFPGAPALCPRRALLPRRQRRRGPSPASLGAEGRREGTVGGPAPRRSGQREKGTGRTRGLGAGARLRGCAAGSRGTARDLAGARSR